MPPKMLDSLIVGKLECGPRFGKTQDLGPAPPRDTLNSLSPKP